MRWVAQISWFRQTSQNVFLLMYQLVPLRSVIVSVTVRLGHRNKSYRLIHLLLSRLKVSDTHASQKSVLHVASYLNTGKSLLYSNKSTATLTYRKISEFCCRLVFWPKPLCSFMFMHVRVLSIGFCQHSSYRGLSRRSPSWTDWSRRVLVTS